MRRIKFFMDKQVPTVEPCEEVFEFDDSATKEEIDAVFTAWVFQFLDSGYSEIKEDWRGDNMLHDNKYVCKEKLLRGELSGIEKSEPDFLRNGRVEDILAGGHPICEGCQYWESCWEDY